MDLHPTQPEPPAPAPLIARVIPCQRGASSGPFGCLLLARYGEERVVRAFRLRWAERPAGITPNAMKTLVRAAAIDAALDFAAGAASRLGPPSAIGAVVDRSPDEGARLGAALAAAAGATRAPSLPAAVVVKALPRRANRPFVAALARTPWSPAAVEAAVAADLGWAEPPAADCATHARPAADPDLLRLAVTDDPLRAFEAISRAGDRSWFAEWQRLRACAAAVLEDAASPLDLDEPRATTWNAIAALHARAALLALLDAPAGLPRDTAQALAADAAAVASPADEMHCRRTERALLGALRLRAGRRDAVAAALPRHPLLCGTPS